MGQVDLHRLLEQWFLSLISAPPSVEEQRVARQLYLLLADGTPVSREHLASSLGMSIATVNKALLEFPQRYIGFDEQGRVFEFGGFGPDPAPNRFTVRGHTLYAWCAWDSLFIPPIVDEPAFVEATCPVTGNPISMTVTPKGVIDVKPGSTVMTFAIPGMEAFPDPERFSFMKTVFFFTSSEVATKWTSENPGPVVLSLDEGFELGRTMNKIRFKDVLNL